MRGEYAQAWWPGIPAKELPPHARRILAAVAGPALGAGTTSACAENTRPLLPAGGFSGNYLRMRGEYGVPGHMMDMDEELPPHARRIPRRPGRFSVSRGTTSACAENTRYRPRHHEDQWNYLRMRGEYRPPPKGPTRQPELPPRARRIQEAVVELPAVQGTTSACAENTVKNFSLDVRFWNYLRVRGEYQAF